MFAIKLEEYRVGVKYPSQWRKKAENVSASHIGWLKRVTPRREVVPADELRFIPSVTDNIDSGAKVWKTKESAITFAKTLGNRLEIIVPRSIVMTGNAPYQRVLPFEICVYDLDSYSIIYHISTHCEDTYSDNLSR